MIITKFCCRNRRKYCFPIVGILLIGIVVGLFLALNKDSIQDLQSSTFSEMDMEKRNIEKCFPQYKRQSADYIEHDPIFIDGNNNLIIQAAAEGWSGDGSEINPIVIDNLIINLDPGDTGSDLINIQNTDLYFRISNCVLDGLGWGRGIFLNDTSNGYITNNTIINIGSGIRLAESENNIITDNFVYNNNLDGIFIGPSSNDNIIRNNIFHDNHRFGIFLLYSDNCAIVNNTAFNNSRIGVFLVGESDNNTISSNTISKNQEIGIVISNISDNNIVRWNNIIDNNPSLGIQALDNGSNNLFVYNYWNEWTSPDTNGDGYVDDPYLIDGGGQDNHPLIYMHNLSNKLAVLFPNGGEILEGTALIQWTDPLDSYNHTKVFSLYYSTDNGENWNFIVSNLDITQYSWNINSMEGSSYLIKVIATCSEGLMIEDISDGAFSISHSITSPEMLFPNGGEILDGKITIEWRKAVDPQGHSISYSVFYSSDNGSTWVSFDMSGLVEGFEIMYCYLDWDTSTLLHGTNFLLKVIATCSFGGEAEDITDNFFTIHYVTKPTSITINYNTNSEGIINIVWSPSVDSFGQNITYSVYYSSDRGNNWILLASGLTDTHYEWNTTTVSDGRNYRIKVVSTSFDGLSTENILFGMLTIDNIPTDYTFLIIGLAVIAIIPEFYFFRKLKKFANYLLIEEGVETL